MKPATLILHLKPYASDTKPKPPCFYLFETKFVQCWPISFQVSDEEEEFDCAALTQLGEGAAVREFGWI